MCVGRSCTHYVIANLGNDVLLGVVWVQRCGRHVTCQVQEVGRGFNLCGRGRRSVMHLEFGFIDVQLKELVYKAWTSAGVRGQKLK